MGGVQAPVNRIFLLALLLCVLLPTTLQSEESPKVVHVFVALCDNEHQGIAKVPARIGNGDDPASNLYWGCSDGMKLYFKNSDRWTLKKSVERPGGADSVILERCVFLHVSGKMVVVADAYRGREMKSCLDDLYAAIAASGEPVECEGHSIGGGADLIAFIGHNGLMEHDIQVPRTKRVAPVPVVVLGCVTQLLFAPDLEAMKGDPLLLTDSLMYPGSFLLHDLLEGWILREDKASLRLRAAKAYAKNQKISVKSASGVFSTLE